MKFWKPLDERCRDLMSRDQNWDLVSSAAFGESLTMSQRENVGARLLVFRIEVGQEVGNAFVHRIVVEERGRQRPMEEGLVMCGHLVLVCMVSASPEACRKVTGRPVSTLEVEEKSTNSAKTIPRLARKAMVWKLHCQRNQTLR